MATEIKAAGAVGLLMACLREIFAACPVFADTMPASALLLEQTWRRRVCKDNVVSAASEAAQAAAAATAAAAAARPPSFSSSSGRFSATSRRRAAATAAATLSLVTGARVRAVSDYGPVHRGALGTFVSARSGVMWDQAPRRVVPFPVGSLEPVDAASGRVFGQQAIVVADPAAAAGRGANLTHLNPGAYLGKVVSVIQSNGRSMHDEILTEVSAPAGPWSRWLVLAARRHVRRGARVVWLSTLRTAPLPHLTIHCRTQHRCTAVCRLRAA
jgi:hypothetical protein